MPLDLHNPNNQHLIDAGFSITEIEKSPTLVKLLNQFHGTLTIDHNQTLGFVGAKSVGNTIQIAHGFKNLLVIAHELGHANGRYQQINADKNNLYRFDNPKDYGMARAIAEGEAMYYEFLVAKELGLVTFKKPLWQDNEATPKDLDVFDYVNHIMLSPISEADKIHTLAILNQAILSSGQLHAPLYTYDEYNTLVFLNNRFPESRISTDFRQIFDKDFDWNTFEAKSLANRANGYYGTLGDDVLINHHEGGSALGQQGQGDLLWGSAGNDVLVGNSGKDNLLGGQGNDVLIGGAGNDILAGGQGNDLYYLKSGFGQDTIINKGGGVDNVYLAGVSYDQVSLVSQVHQDLVVSLARTGDQLTVKDYFATVNLSKNTSENQLNTTPQIYLAEHGNDMSTLQLIPNEKVDSHITAEHQHALSLSLSQLEAAKLSLQPSNMPY